MAKANATAFKIEKDVPPPIGDGRGTPRLYPFGDMEVGDSFLITGATEGDISLKRTKLHSAACYYGARHDRKFVTRTVPGGVRCWRAV